MNPSIKKGLLTHGLAIVGFLTITFIIYYPQFLSDERLFQHDILQGVGGNHQMIEHRNETGEEALWMNSMFSGMPAYLNGVQFSGDLLQYVYRVITMGLGHPAGITFCGCICFYIMLLTFGVRPWIAFMGALSFSLNGFSIIGISAGHNAKIAAVTFFPLLIAGLQLAFNDRRWLGFGITAIAMGLHLRFGHYQMTYYLIAIVAAFGIYRLVLAVQEQKLKPFLITSAGLILAAVIGLGSNAGKLITVYEYSKVSIRGKSELKADGDKASGLDKDYAFEFSNEIFEPLVLFIPNIYGGASSQELSKSSATAKALSRSGYGPAQLRDAIKSMPTYWGNQRLSAPYYAGSVAILLFVVSLFVLKRKEKIWLIVLVVLGIVLSWGDNFSSLNYLLFDYLPMYNKFRSVTFAIIISIFAINLGGFLALERVFQSNWDKNKWQQLMKASAIPIGFALLMIVTAGVFSYKGAIDERLPEWLIGALREDRVSLLRKDAFRAIAFIAAFCALFWAMTNKKMGSSMAIGALILVVFVDSITLTKRFIKPDDFAKSPVEDYFKPTPADEVIMNRAKSGERVLNLRGPFNEGRTSYFHESLGGYHGAKMRRYQDLIEHCISPELSTLINRLQNGQRNFADLSIINMLNTKFFMAGQSKDAVLMNANALGNAWVVNEIIEVNSPDEELAQINQINPGETAVMDASKFDAPQVDDHAKGSIKILEREPNQILYEANISGNGLAVFSEIYYEKGWKAFIDGTETNILRANYVLRALPISTGNHEIKMVFEPKSYTLANNIMWVCSVLTLLLFVGSVAIYSVRKDQQ